MLSLNQYLFNAFFIGSIISSSCNHTSVKTIVNQGNQIQLDTTDCFPDRKSQDTIYVELGIIDKISDQFYITSSANSNRFIACNMPEECKTIDMKVRCRLVIKEIYPQERRAGTPVLLQAIAILEP